MKLRSIILATLFCFFIGEAGAVCTETDPDADALESPALLARGGSVRKKGEKKKTRDGELPRQGSASSSASLVTVSELPASETNDSNNSTTASGNDSHSSTTSSDEELNPSLVYSEAIIATASPLLGCKYVYGSKGPKTFDCSGFTSYVYREATGMTIAVNSAGQSTGGYAVSNNDLRPGDLVFFTGQNATAKTSKTVGHVGIIIASEGPSDFWFMHASSSRGVTVDHITQTEYFRTRFLWARRMF